MRRKAVLFVDFNGVISQFPYWHSIREEAHSLHGYHEQIEEFLFRSNNHVFRNWMLGEYSAEDIHELLNEKIGVSKELLYQQFILDCKKIDISSAILSAVSHLKRSCITVLSTANTDAFERFILPEFQQLRDTFDFIDNSHAIGLLKSDCEGKYFLDRLRSLDVKPQDAWLIDDGEKNCEIFSNLGGSAHRVTNETEALQALRLIRQSV